MATTSCPDCGRPCQTGAGLASHRRKCARTSRASADRTETAQPLGTRGQAFADQVLALYELSVSERRGLEDVCREIDLIERLQVALDKGSLVVNGSMGQPVASPLVQEIRQHRAVLDRLLKSLGLPSEEGTAAGARATSARERALARWGAGGA